MQRPAVQISVVVANVRAKAQNPRWSVRRVRASGSDGPPPPGTQRNLTSKAEAEKGSPRTALARGLIDPKPKNNFDYVVHGRPDPPGEPRGREPERSPAGTGAPSADDAAKGNRVKGPESGGGSHAATLPNPETMAVAPGRVLSSR